MSKMEQIIRDKGYEGKYCVGFRRFFGPYTLVCCHTKKQVNDLVTSYKEWDDSRSIGCCNAREWKYKELKQLVNNIFVAEGQYNDNYTFEQFDAIMLFDHSDLS